MSVVIGLGIFIIGVLVGFILNKLVFNSSQEKEILVKAKQTEASLTQYKKDVAEHLNSSAALLAKMNETCQTAMAQMSKSTELLQQATPEPTENIPYFSQETHDEIQETIALRPKDSDKKSDYAITEPPLDYSGNGSGLFNSEK